MVLISLGFYSQNQEAATPKKEVKLSAFPVTVPTMGWGFAIDTLQVAAPGFPVTTIVCAPDAVPKLVKKLFISVADIRLFVKATPLVKPVAINLCKEFTAVKIVAMFVTLVPIISA